MNLLSLLDHLLQIVFRTLSIPEVYSTRLGPPNVIILNFLQILIFLIFLRKRLILLKLLSREQDTLLVRASSHTSLHSTPKSPLSCASDLDCRFNVFILIYWALFLKRKICKKGHNLPLANSLLIPWGLLLFHIVFILLWGAFTKTVNIRNLLISFEVRIIQILVGRDIRDGIIVMENVFRLFFPILGRAVS